MAEKNYTREQLEEMDKSKLEKLAQKRGLTVTRGDGAEGEPLKDDYITALAGGAIGAVSSGEPGERLDKTIPGGRYKNRSGDLVNSEGHRINDDGSLIEDDE